MVSGLNSLVREKLQTFLLVPLLIIYVILISPLVLMYLTFRLLYGVILTIFVWESWGSSSGVPVLFVYSNSPNWQDYIENNLIPKMPKNLIVLNWSERKNWKKYSLSVLAFKYFGGDREFNPIAIVFQRRDWPQTYRFWSAFKERKHGIPEPLVELESEFFQKINTRN